jgi:hypothetical protein
VPIHLLLQVLLELFELLRHTPHHSRCVSTQQRQERAQRSPHTTQDPGVTSLSLLTNAIFSLSACRALRTRIAQSDRGQATARVANRGAASGHTLLGSKCRQQAHRLLHFRLELVAFLGGALQRQPLAINLLLNFVWTPRKV